MLGRFLLGCVVSSTFFYAHSLAANCEHIIGDPPQLHLSSLDSAIVWDSTSTLDILCDSAVEYDLFIYEGGQLYSTPTVTSTFCEDGLSLDISGLPAGDYEALVQQRTFYDFGTGPYCSETEIGGSIDFVVNDEINGGDGTVVSPPGTYGPYEGTAKFGSAYYDIYRSGSDSMAEIYMHALDQFILLHEEIITPILIDPEPSLIFETEGSDSFAYALLVDRYTDDELDTLTKLTEGVHYFWGDYDGDGDVELLLIQNGISVIDVGDDILSNGAEAVYALSTEFPPEVSAMYDEGLTVSFSSQDVDGDGRHELVADPSGAYATVYIDLSVNDNQELSYATHIQSSEPLATPTLVGASNGNFRVDEVGAATYSLALTTPAGTAGVAPGISLMFSSQGGDGIAGQGWSLSGLSSVSRCRQTLAHDGVAKPITWSADDRFCLDGQRLVAVSGNYGAVGTVYQTEINSQVYVTAVGGSNGHPNYFMAERQDGSVSYYGNTANSQQQNGDGQVNTWAQNRFEDSVGNGINYVYTQNNGSDFYISQIDYAYGSGSESNAQISFYYENKLKHTTAYLAGHSFTSSKRLDHVIVRNREPDAAGSNASNLTEIRRYNLHYKTPVSTTTDKRSFLIAIQECVGNACLPATTFDWELNRGLIYDTPEYTGTILEDKSFLSGLVPIDINGDSYRDLVWLEQDEHHQDYDYELGYSVFDPETQRFVRGEFLDAHGDYIGISGNPRSQREQAHLSVLDYNGDNRQDIAVYADLNDTWRVFLSTPDASDGSWKIRSNYNNGIVLPFTDKATVFIDLNSDGLADALTQDRVYYLEKSSNNLSSSTLYSYSRNENVSFVNASGSIFDPFGAVENSDTEYNVKQKDFIPAGDLNGDGRADIIVVSRLISGDIIDNYYFVDSAVEEHYHAAVQEEGSNGAIQFRIVSSIGSFTESDRTDLKDSEGLYNTQFHAYYANYEPLIPFFVQDINGDGLTDVIQGQRVSSVDETGMNYRLYINNGVDFESPTTVLSVDNEEDTTFQLVDMNEDGHADIVWHIKEEDSGVYYKLWDSNASAYENSATDLTEYTAVSSTGTDSERHFFYDTNADGHLDYLHFNENDIALYLNEVTAQDGLMTAFTTGLGATTQITYESLIQSDHYDGIRYVDGSDTETTRSYTWNGRTMDWKTTSAAATADAFYTALNSPFAGLADTEQTLAEAYVSPVFEYVAPLYIVTRVEGAAPTASVTAAGDVNPDATSAIEYIYEQAKVQAGGRGFLGFKSLTTIDWQTGIKTQTQYRQDWPFIGSPLETNAYTEDDELLSRKTNDWAIVNWDTAWIDAIAEGIEPLAPFTLYIAENVDTKYKFSSDAADPSQIRGDYAKGGGTSVVYCKMGAACPSGATVPSVLQTITTNHKYDSYGNAYEITVETAGDGLTLTTKTENDYDSDLDAATLLDGATIAFDDGRSASYRRLGRLTNTKVTTTLNGESTVRTSRFSYYSSGHEAGLLATETTEPDSTNKSYTLLTSYTYDDFGNKLSVLTPGEQDVYNFAGNVSHTTNFLRASTYAYDALGRYVDYSTNGLGHKSPEVQERSIFGTPTRVSSENNNLVSHNEYDVLGRQTYSSDSTGAWVQTEYLSCAQASPSCPSGAVQAVRTSVSGGGQSIKYVDKLARTVREGKVMFDGSWSYTSYEFDALGRTVRISEPHVQGQSNIYWTTNTYDVLGRSVNVEMPYSSTSANTSITRYSGNTVSTMNGINQWSIQENNALGQLVRVEDNLQGELHYTYTIDGHMKTVTFMPNKSGESNTTTTLTYDNIGRKIAMNDPDKGDWEYKYNGLGELVWQKDANGQVVTQSYDTLGRMQTRTDYTSAGEVENHTRWYYDSANDLGDSVAYATGQNTAVVMTKSISHERCDDATVQQCIRPHYDQYARVYETDQLIRENSQFADAANDPINTFTTRVEFDSLGRPSRSFDVLGDWVVDDANTPIESGIENSYNSYGYLDRVTDIYSGRIVQDIVDINVRGQITEMLLGPVTRNNEYDPRTGQLTAQQADITQAFVLQDQRYTWDKIGNLLSRDNQSHRTSGSPRDLKESFCYDGLNRLIKTNSGTLSTSSCDSLDLDEQDIRYAQNGNILYKSDVGNYDYSGASGDHAVDSIDGATFRYDNNGNMIESRYRRLEYTSFDKPYYIERGDYQIEFKYGINRGRYWRQTTNTSAEEVETTLYLGNVEKITKTDGTVQWKRHLPGAVITFDTLEDSASGRYSMLGDEELHHVIKDHLGSVDVVVDADGTLVQSMSFDAWGHRRSETDWDNLSVASQITFDSSITTRGYTGHEMLDQVGLIHMNGRIYDAEIARFLQADPIIQAATFTQNYNRYSYLYNNPLNATDPSGFVHSYIVEREFKKWFGVIAAAVVSIACKACGPQVYAVIAAQSAAINGADGKGMLIAAVTAYASANIGARIGQGEKVLRAVTVGIINGIGSSLQGGKFGHGFASAALSSAASSFGPTGDGAWDIAGRIGIGATAGGTASALTGGKFANGAMTAAFAAAVQAGLSKSSGGSGNPVVDPSDVTDAQLAADVYNPSGKDIDDFVLATDKQAQEVGLSKGYVSDKSGFKMGLYVNSKTGEYVMAFAGTDTDSFKSFTTDFKHNALQAVGLKSSQYTDAIDYGLAAAQNLGRSLRFTGHSLGGGLASAASLVTGSRATTFNAAGLNRATIGRYNANMSNANSLIRAYYSSTDVLSISQSILPIPSAAGNRISLGRAGWHDMKSMCTAIGTGC